MPKVQDSMFTAYDFTAEEHMQGMTLTELQKKFIVHERTLRAQEQMLMPLDEMTTEEFQKKWQRSIGYMEALTWILTCDESVKTDLRQALQEAQQLAKGEGLS